VVSPPRPGCLQLQTGREAKRNAFGAVTSPTRQAAAHLTGFEDSNSSANVGIDRKAAGHGMVPSNMGENLTLINNGSNGDSVPATVPGSGPVRLTRQRLNLGPHPYQGSARGPVSPASHRRPAQTTDRWRPLETVANRSVPMACGPNVDQILPRSGLCYVWSRRLALLCYRLPRRRSVITSVIALQYEHGIAMGR
jgi:hypothetical protein